MADFDDAVADGTYRIINYISINGGASGKSSELCLDINGNGLWNGTNVQIYQSNWKAAQFFEIQKHKKGGYTINGRFSGRYIDIAGGVYANGTNIQIYDGNNAEAQRWRFETTGKTVTYKEDQQIYPVYRIKAFANSNYGMKLNGTFSEGTTTIPENGTNVILSTIETNSVDGIWLLAPVPVFRDTGIYKIHSVKWPDQVLDSTNHGTYVGNPMCTWSDYDGINQKFQFVRQWLYGSGGADDKPFFKIYPMHTRHLALNAAEAGVHDTRNGAPLTQDLDTAHDSVYYATNEWLIETRGTFEYKGHKYPKVTLRTYGGDGSGQWFYVYAIKQNAFVEMWKEYSSDENVEFFLVPSESTSENVPVPNNMRFVLDNTDIPNDKLYLTRDEYYAKVKNIHARWDVASKINMGGPLAFDDSLRKRVFDSTNNAWTEWSDWTTSRYVQTEKEDHTCTATSPLGFYGKKDAFNAFWNASDESLEPPKATRLEYSLRMIIPTSYASVDYGFWQEQELKIFLKPTVSFTKCSWDIHGFKIFANSDLAKAFTYVRIHKLTGTYIQNGSSISKDFVTSDFDSTPIVANGSFVIPFDKFGDLSLFGVDFTKISIEYSVCSDMYAMPNDILKCDIPYENISLIAQDPGIQTSKFNKYTLKLEVPKLPNFLVYISFANLIIKPTIYTENNKNIIYVPYKYKTQFDVFVAGGNDDGSDFKYYHHTVTADDDLIRTPIYAHAWNWITSTGEYKALYLELRKDELLETSYTMDSHFSEHKLVGDEYSYISKSNSKTVKFNAEGVLLPEDPFSAVDFDALLSAKDVIYRSPSGQIMYATVTSFSVRETDECATLEINMYKEGDTEWR